MVVIPLLFETAAESSFDSVICVACSAASQRKRLLERGWSAAQIQQRIQAHWPTERNIVLADYAIWTEGGLEVHLEQIERILAKVKRKRDA